MAVLRRNLRSLAITDGSGQKPGQTAGYILDCIELSPAADGRRRTKVFFSPEVPIEQVEPLAAKERRACRSVGGGVIATVTSAADDPVRVKLPQSSLTLTPQPAETELFAGLNCALSERNREPAKVVCDWLVWHAREHALQAALILDRSTPGQADQFAAELGDLLAARKPKLDLKVVVLAADIPLGKFGIGAESHPMNAPGAPGKDRMEPPKDDPWHAPLRMLNIYELARHRFLAEARAVMNIDVYDILPKRQKAETLFDAALSDPQGLIPLSGERSYPWALRKGRDVGFGDHICTRFDSKQRHERWVTAPEKLPSKAVWRMVRMGGAESQSKPLPFYRCMALRFFPEGENRHKVTRIVPKSSLVENQKLLRMARDFGAKPVRMPEAKARKLADTAQRVAIVTTMKNEGPFILEWIAYHRAIGVEDFLVYTNDCDDGTDTMLSLLQDKGIIQHRDNPFRETGLKPQHAALAASEQEPIMRDADWAICMDVDEFITIHAGDGTVQDLFDAVPDANMISMTWRLFGNDNVEEFKDEFITERFTGCAPLMTRKPHQAWGFKTLFRNIGLFKKMGVHRPKGLRPQLVDDVNWVNGSGIKMPKDEYRNAWRSTVDTVGYDLVTLNHYAVRSAESFLVKRDRGRVNHVDRDQGLAYWFRMNNNAEQDRSIHRMLPMLRKEFDALMGDPDIAKAHAFSVARHRTRIDELKAAPKYRDFYAELTGARLQGLSRLHAHFGSAVFLSGPGCIPDDFLDRDLAPGDLFTVPKAKTEH